MIGDLNTINAITILIRRWLVQNDLPREGVSIVLNFPDEHSAQRAECCIKREVEPYRAHQMTSGTFGAIETMNGIGLTLTFSDGTSRRKA